LSYSSTTSKALDVIAFRRSRLKNSFLKPIFLAIMMKLSAIRTRAATISS
jgi:hypothetical protein